MSSPEEPPNRSRMPEDERHLSGNPRVALVSRQRISVAVGIVMERLTVTDVQALETLVALSRESKRTLRDIADEMVLTGQIPPRRRGE